LHITGGTGIGGRGKESIEGGGGGGAVCGKVTGRFPKWSKKKGGNK